MGVPFKTLIPARGNGELSFLGVIRVVIRAIREHLYRLGCRRNFRRVKGHRFDIYA